MPDMKSFGLKDILLDKINKKNASVGVVGLGYVGLPFAVEKAKVGFNVIGIEENPQRAGMINAGQNYISDVVDEELTLLVKKGKLKAKANISALDDLDIIVICVPTPLTKNLVPDLQYVEKVTKEIAKYLRSGQLISLESTTYPGTTEEIILPILEGSGLKAEQDFYLCHSPERVDPGNKRYTTKNTNKILGAIGPKSLEVAKAFYEKTITNIITVSSPKIAEMVKVYENTFRAVNIALVNELTILCDRMEISAWEVLDAAFTKPFGIMPFYPGPGVGGHCIPIDPHYLEWKAREYNFTTRFIGLAGEINRQMPEFVKEKTLRALNEIGKAPSKSTILIIGMAYKKDISDYRGSPAIDIAEQLINEGVNLIYHDPFIDNITIGEKQFNSTPLGDELLKEVDLVLIATDHSNIDYQWLVDQSSKILDTRNATKNVLEDGNKVILI